MATSVYFFSQRLTVSLNSFLFILLSHRFIDRSLRYVWIFRRFVTLEFLRHWMDKWVFYLFVLYSWTYFVCNKKLFVWLPFAISTQTFQTFIWRTLLVFLNFMFWMNRNIFPHDESRHSSITSLSFLEEEKLEAALQRCSQEKVFWKYTANLQENTYVEVWFSIKLQSNWDWNHTSTWGIFCKFAACFQNIFL